MTLKRPSRSDALVFMPGGTVKPTGKVRPAIKVIPVERQEDEMSEEQNENADEALLNVLLEQGKRTAQNQREIEEMLSGTRKDGEQDDQEKE